MRRRNRKQQRPGQPEDRRQQEKCEEAEHMRSSVEQGFKVSQVSKFQGKSKRRSFTAGAQLRV
jgi:hypothetical protein